MAPGRYKVEKGVPVPRTRRGRPRLYPWEQLAVGDSFLVACEEGDKRKTLHRARNAAAMFAKRRGLDWRFSFRQVEGGIRIWRMK